MPKFKVTVEKKQLRIGTMTVSAKDESAALAKVSDRLFIGDIDKIKWGKAFDDAEDSDPYLTDDVEEV